MRQQPDLVALGAQGALDHIGDAEIPAEGLRVGLGVQAKARWHGIDAEMREAHQVGYDLVGEAGGEVVILRVVAERVERQDEDRRPDDFFGRL